MVFCYSGEARASGGRKYQASFRGQGTVEYLVIIAVVVVISLVVTGIVISQSSSAGSVSESVSDIKSKVGVGEISISNSVAGLDENALLVLQAPVGENITVSKIVIDGVDHNFSASLYGGSPKSFKVQEVGSCNGQKKTYSVKVVYTSSSGLEKTSDFQEIEVPCVSVVQTGGSSSASTVEETPAPVVLSFSELCKIQASDKQADDFFGFSSSISGDYAIIGTPFEDTGATNAGAVYIFKKNAVSGLFEELQKIQAADKQASDMFGVSGIISGDYAFVGSPYDDNGATDTGSVYVYKLNAVSISGDYAIVSGYQEDTGATDAGAAYIFKLG